MEIISKWGANYLVGYKKDYKVKAETLYFGEHKITPGTKIVKIGIKRRSSFTMNNGNYLEYEGTFLFKGVKYCSFNPKIEEQSINPNTDRIYRNVFMIPMCTTKIDFLLISSTSGQGCHDLDATHIELYQD